MYCEHDYIYTDDLKICTKCADNDTIILNNDSNNDNKCINNEQHNIIDYDNGNICNKCGLIISCNNIDNNEYYKINTYKHKYNFNKRLNYLTNKSNINYNNVININDLINELRNINDINYNIALRLRNKYGMKRYDIIHIFNLYCKYNKPVLYLTVDEVIKIKYIFNQFIRYWFNNLCKKNILQKRKNLLNYDFILGNILKLCNISHNPLIFKSIKKIEIKCKYKYIWRLFIKSFYLKVICKNFFIN
jgi:hypothetical protein